MEIDTLLEDLNLTQIEIKIYKLLMHRGPTPAGEIARKIGSHRRNTYDAIDRMIYKGFLGYIKENNLKYFQIQDPNTLVESLKAKQHAWEKIIPQIEEDMKTWQDKKETLFFRGKTGIKQVFSDILEQKAEVLVKATSKDIRTFISYFFTTFEKERIDRNISFKMIFDTDTSKDIKEVVESQNNCSITYFKSFNSTPVSQYIYNNNVATILWLDSEPSVILVKGSEYANFHREQFELLWNNTKQ
jgi:sugar-specific transcriptional regulator TrmB